MRPALLSLALVLAWTPAAAAEEPAADALYLILDGSGSMWGELPDGTTKIEAAKRGLSELAGGDFGEQQLALRVYGHRREGDCADTELVVAFASAAEATAGIRVFAGTVRPKGKTPISRSLRAALEDRRES